METPRQPVLCPAIGFLGFDSVETATAYVPIIKALTTAFQSNLRAAIDAALVGSTWPTAIATYAVAVNTDIATYAEGLSVPALMTYLSTHVTPPAHTYYAVSQGAGGKAHLSWSLVQTADIEASSVADARGWWEQGILGAQSAVTTAVQVVCTAHGWTGARCAAGTVGVSERATGKYQVTSVWVVSCDVPLLGPGV